VDPGHCDIPIGLRSLREVLAMRQDELLAASVGTRCALARIAAGLSRDQLRRAAYSEEITPSLVRERVEVPVNVPSAWVQENDGASSQTTVAVVVFG